MKSWRLAFFVFLICLPAVLLISVGAFLIVRNVPRNIRTAPSRIGREYREIAEELVERRRTADRADTRPTGWRQVGKINGVPWGYVVDGDRSLVWFKDGEKSVRWCETPTLRPFPYVAVFYVGGSAVALVLIFLSVLAAGCFVRFMKERDDFLAATAHDLTTPLVGMRMMIGRDDDEAKKLNERMLLLVGNIKDFLKLGGRRRKPDLKSIDIEALSHEAYWLFAADYEDSEGGAVSFAKECDGGGAVVTQVCADETMTLQILWNLFGNDLKYAAPYGKVSVRFSAAGECVKVEFVDEGPGMTPQQRRKAFDRYYRAKTVLETGKGGFGIGLCTAREFARAMGGDLTVRANEPKGCVFALTLPAAGV